MRVPLSSLKNAKFRHGTAGLSNVGVSPIGAGENPSDFRFQSELLQRFGQFVIIDSLAVFIDFGVVCFREVTEKPTIGSILLLQAERSINFLMIFLSYF